MSLADGVTGVVLADGGWLEARPACGPIGCPWRTLFGEYLPPTHRQLAVELVVPFVTQG